MEQEQKTQTQDAILLAALKLFAEKGYFNTSLNDIANAAGLNSTTALYQYFSNKHQIAATLHASILDSLNVSIDEIRRKNSKPSEQLHGVVDLLFKLTDEAPAVTQFILTLNTNEFLPETKSLNDTAAFTKILKIIRAGISEGEIRPIDAVLANAYFFGIVHNTLRMVLSGALEKKAEAYLSQTWLIAWNAIAKK